MLAFRGAEGFGRNATGGRGGAIIPVTTLADNGSNSSPTPGSFRAALLTSGPRHIVFAVAGTIEHISSTINATNVNMSDFTIHGHIAPGDGVTLKGRQIVFRGLNNFVIRFLRSRAGMQTSQSDCMDFKQCSNFMVDHCSLSWSRDEVMSPNGVADATYQWCIISEALNRTDHSSTPNHGYGSLAGGKYLSIYANLFAHNYHRNPRFSSVDQADPFPRPDWMGFIDVRNNLVFNWGEGAITGGGGNDPRQKIQIVKNLFISGPAFTNTSSNIPKGSFCTASAYPGNSSGTYAEFHLDGNWIEGDGSQIFEDVTNDNKLGFKTSPSLSEGNRYALLSETPLFATEVYDNELETKEQVREFITDYAGSSLRRDAIDARIINDVLTNPASYGAASNGSGTGGLIDHEDDRGGYVTMATTPALPTNTAGDYIADSWKTANGYDINTNYEGVIDEATGYDIFELYSMDVAKSVAEFYNDRTINGDLTITEITSEAILTNGDPAINLTGNLVVPEITSEAVLEFDVPVYELNADLTIPEITSEAVLTNGEPNFLLSGDLEIPFITSEAVLESEVPVYEINGNLLIPKITSEATLSRTVPVYEINGNLLIPEITSGALLTNGDPANNITGDIQIPAIVSEAVLEQVVPVFSITGHLLIPQITSGANLSTQEDLLWRVPYRGKMRKKNKLK